MSYEKLHSSAQILIEELQAENEKLKQKIAQLSESDINKQVDSSYRINKMIREKDTAMAKFTKRIINETRRHQEQSDG